MVKRETFEMPEEECHEKQTDGRNLPEEGHSKMNISTEERKSIACFCSLECKQKNCQNSQKEEKKGIF